MLIILQKTVLSTSHFYEYIVVSKYISINYIFHVTSVFIDICYRVATVVTITLGVATWLMW